MVMILVSDGRFDIEDGGVDESAFDTVKRLHEEMVARNFVVCLPSPVLGLLLSVSFCRLI